MNISITDYLHNKNVLKYSLFTIENGKGYYTVKGIKFDADEMQQFFPTNCKVQILSNGRYKGESIDPRTNWRQ